MADWFERYERGYNYANDKQFSIGKYLIIVI